MFIVSVHIQYYKKKKKTTASVQKENYSIGLKLIAHHIVPLSDSWYNMVAMSDQSHYIRVICFFIKASSDRNLLYTLLSDKCSDSSYSVAHKVQEQKRLK